MSIIAVTAFLGQKDQSGDFMRPDVELDLKPCSAPPIAPAPRGSPLSLANPPLASRTSRIELSISGWLDTRNLHSDGAGTSQNFSGRIIR